MAARWRFRSGTEMKVCRSMGTRFSHELNPAVKPLAKPYALAGGYSARMDVTTTRTANFRVLVDREIAKGRTKREAAIRLDLSASFLSQLYGGKKIGDEVARKLEVAAGLPRGSMDIPFEMQFGGAASVAAPDFQYPSSASQPERLVPKILAASIKVVRMACEALQVPFDVESEADSAIVLIAYDYLNARRESEVTADNVVSFTKYVRKVLQEGGKDGRPDESRSAGGGARK